MEGTPFIRTLSLTHFLSFGAAGEELPLLPLNVLIGPNGSGKSNLIEAISLLQAAPTDLTAPIREGGGIAEWLWKGPDARTVAEIKATVAYPDGVMPLRYRLALTPVGQRMAIQDEAVENEGPQSEGADTEFFFRYENGQATFAHGPCREVSVDEALRRIREKPKAWSVENSVLSHGRDPEHHPEVSYLAEHFRRIKLYREWGLGRRASARLPQRADLPEDFLLEDAGNLGLVLNDLEHRGAAWEQFRSYLGRFHEGVLDVTTKIHGGTVQVFVHEKGLSQPIPATRLSDGTLRFLCLLAILCHPEPPPLICIEEPELGLHPDIMPTIAELLLDAAKRTQLIVTTHSDVLVSEFSDVPEAVLVCEREEDGTRMRRLDREPLMAWLEKYRLGEMWRMGEIGGNRW